LAMRVGSEEAGFDRLRPGSCTEANGDDGAVLDYRADRLVLSKLKNEPIKVGAEQGQLTVVEYSRWIAIQIGGFREQERWAAILRAERTVGLDKRAVAVTVDGPW